jgi:hypothetical protein
VNKRKEKVKTNKILASFITSFSSSHIHKGASERAGEELQSLRPFSTDREWEREWKNFWNVLWRNFLPEKNYEWMTEWKNDIKH